MSEVRAWPDGSTIAVFVPIAWRRRGGRKVIMAPPGCEEWAPGAEDRARAVEGIGARAPLAAAAGGGALWHPGRAGGGRTDQPKLRMPRSAPDPPCPRHRRTDSERAADGRAGSVPEAGSGRVGKAAESPLVTDAAVRVSTASDMPQILGEDRALTLAGDLSTRYGREV
jgi:hypothetical protein